MNRDNDKIDYKSYSFERLLIEASHILNQDLEQATLMKNILSILIDYLEAEASAIYVTGSRENRSELFTLAEAKEIVHKVDVSEEDKGIANLVIDSGKPLVLNKEELDGELKTKIDTKINVNSRNVMASPIIRRDKIMGVIEVFNKKGSQDFDDNDLEIMNALGEQIALALANARLIRRARRKTAEAQSLYEVGKMMSAALELEELLNIIVDQVSRLVNVDVATIYIVNPQDGSIKDIVSKGITEELRPRLPVKIGEGICGLAAKGGQTIVLNDVSREPRYISLRESTKSEVALPLKARGRLVGVFNIESDRMNAYNTDDVELLETFASQAAVSIERAILYQQIIEQKALADELVIARRIQETFLPKEAPEIPGFDIAGLNMPSEAVGGDYFDFIPIVDKQIGIAIGDVSGKGTGAALIMAAFRASLKAEIRNNYAIRTIFSKVNSLMFESIERENYVTAVYGVLDTKNRVFTFSNAGHNPPLLFKHTGEIVELTEGGLALGTFPDSTYEERPIYINPGDILLFYTDGITEARDADDREFGTERLKELVWGNRDLPSREIINSIIEAVEKYRQDNSQDDDLTMVMVKCLASEGNGKD